MMPNTEYIKSPNRSGVQYARTPYALFENNHHRYYLITEYAPNMPAIKRILVETIGVTEADFQQWHSYVRQNRINGILAPLDCWVENYYTIMWVADASGFPDNVSCHNLTDLLLPNAPNFLKNAYLYLSGCAAAEQNNLSATTLLYFPQKNTVLVDTSPWHHISNVIYQLWDRSPEQHKMFFYQLSRQTTMRAALSKLEQYISQIGNANKPAAYSPGRSRTNQASQAAMPINRPSFTHTQQKANKPLSERFTGTLGKVDIDVTQGIGVIVRSTVGQNPTQTPTRAINVSKKNSDQPSTTSGKKPFQTPPTQPQHFPFQHNPVTRQQPARPMQQVRSSTTAVQVCTVPTTIQPAASTIPEQLKTASVINANIKDESTAKTHLNDTPQPAPNTRVWPFTEYRLHALPEVGATCPAVHMDTEKLVLIQRFNHSDKDLLKFFHVSQHDQLRHPLVPVPGLCLLQDVNTDADPKSFYVVRQSMDVKGWLPVGHPHLLSLEQKDKLLIARNMTVIFNSIIADGWLPSKIVEANMPVDPKTFAVCFADGHLLSTDMGAPLTCTLGYAAPECTGKNPKAELPAVSYALAVWLFRLFVGGYPLEGRQTLQALKDSGKPEAEMTARLYGGDAQFCFDPANDRNSLVDLGGHYSQMVRRWVAQPDVLRNLWIKTFADHLHHKIARRPEPAEWLEIIDNLL